MHFQSQLDRIDCCSTSKMWWKWVPDRRAKMRRGMITICQDVKWLYHDLIKATKVGLSKILIWHSCITGFQSSLPWSFGIRDKNPVKGYHSIHHVVGEKMDLLKAAKAGLSKILIWRSCITGSPSSLPRSFGSLLIDSSSSLMLRGKYRGSKLLYTSSKHTGAANVCTHPANIQGSQIFWHILQTYRGSKLLYTSCKRSLCKLQIVLKVLLKLMEWWLN